MSNFKEKFGKRLKDARTIRMLSQQDLADGLNLSRSTISKYERGLKLIDTKTMCLMCDFLEIRPGFFFQDNKVKISWTRGAKLR